MFTRRLDALVSENQQTFQLGRGTNPRVICQNTFVHDCASSDHTPAPVTQGPLIRAPSPIELPLPISTGPSLSDSNLLSDCKLESAPFALGSLLPYSTLLPDSHLRKEPQASSIDTGSKLLPGDLMAGRETDRSLPGSKLPLEADSIRAAPAGSSLLSDSTLLPDSDLRSEPQASSIDTGSKLLPGGDLMAGRETDRSLPGSKLPLEADSIRAAPADSSLLSDSTLLPDSDLRSELPGSIDTGSTLLPGGDLRTPNGRVVRLRPARSVQDAHTNGEHLLLTAMWKKGTPESEDSRLLRAGLSELARLTGSHKTSCRAYLRALVAKLALEEAETFDAAAGSEGARVYRIFSFNTILERRRRANLTHVIRTGAVSFVNPKTGERLTASGNLLPDSNLPVVSNVLPESNFPTDPGSNHHHAPDSNHPPLNKNKDQELSKQTSSSAALYQALSKYGAVDDDVLTRLI